MQNHHLTRIISADRHFDQIDGITRIDPRSMFGVKMGWGAEVRLLPKAGLIRALRLVLILMPLLLILGVVAGCVRYRSIRNQWQVKNRRQRPVSMRMASSLLNTRRARLLTPTALAMKTPRPTSSSAHSRRS